MQIGRARVQPSDADTVAGHCLCDAPQLDVASMNSSRMVAVHRRARFFALHESVEKPDSREAWIDDRLHFISQDLQASPRICCRDCKLADPGRLVVFGQTRKRNGCSIPAATLAAWWSSKRPRHLRRSLAVVLRLMITTGVLDDTRIIHSRSQWCRYALQRTEATRFA